MPKVPYIISETEDGRFIVQTPNRRNGLFPLMSSQDDCRSTVKCFEAIAMHALDTGNLFDGIEIVFRYSGHPLNSFNY